MSPVVLDASAVAAVLHRLPEAVVRLAFLRPADVVLSAPVAAEIEYGLERLPERSRHRELLEGEYARLCSVVQWQDWTKPAALLFGRLKARLFEVGEALDDFDLVIASIALALDASLATLEPERFRGIDALVIDPWR